MWCGAHRRLKLIPKLARSYTKNVARATSRARGRRERTLGPSRSSIKNVARGTSHPRGYSAPFTIVHQTAPDGPRRPQTAPDGPRRPQTVPDGPRWPQTAWASLGQLGAAWAAWASLGKHGRPKPAWASLGSLGQPGQPGQAWAAWGSLAQACPACCVAGKPRALCVPAYVMGIQGGWVLALRQCDIEFSWYRFANTSGP